MATPSIGPTFGAYLLGTFLSLVLYGLFLHQTYVYFRKFPTETFFIRFLVISVVFIETIHCVSNMHTCYYYLVTHYFEPQFLVKPVWSLNCTILFAGLNMIICQLVFVRRVFMMGRQYVFTAILAIGFLILQIALSIVNAQKAFVGPGSDLAAYELSANHIVAGTFAASLAGDVLLTGPLLWGVYRSRSSLPSGDSVFDTIIIYAINTGLVHAIFNLVAMISALALPQTLVDGSLGIIVAKVYANTLLSVLNSRTLTASSGIEIFGGSTFGHSSTGIIARANRLAAQERWNVPQVADAAPAVINIKVTTETEDEAASTLKDYDKELDV